MANLGQIDKSIEDYINSPVKRIGETSIQQNDAFSESNLAKARESFGKYRVENEDKPFYDDAQAVVKSIGKGIVVNTPEMVGQAAQALSPEKSVVSDWGKRVVDSAKARAEDWKVDMKGRDKIASALISGGEMIGPSIASLPAYLAGPIPGAAATIALYGGSSYQEVYDRAKAKGLSDSDAHVAGLLEGGIEVGGELISNKLSLGLLGAGRKAAPTMAKVLTGKAADTSVLKPFGKAFAKEIVGENVTEGLQNYGQSQVEGEYNLSPSKSLGESFSETLGPTTGMSVLLSPFGLAGHFVSAKASEQQNQKDLARVQAISHILDDPQSGSGEDRLRVVNMLHDTAIQRGVDKKEADAWRSDAFKSIATKQPIPRYNVSEGDNEKGVDLAHAEDALPSGEKIVNKDLTKIYNKYDDLYGKFDDPNDPDYQSGFKSAIQSLQSIINQDKEGKVDHIKKDEANKILNVIELAHRDLVKRFNKEMDEGKTQEEIIQSDKQDESDSSAQLESELEDLKELSNGIDKVITDEDLVTEPSPFTPKTKESIIESTDKLISSLNKAVSPKENNGTISTEELKSLMDSNEDKPVESVIKEEPKVEAEIPSEPAVSGEVQPSPSTPEVQAVQPVQVEKGEAPAASKEVPKKPIKAPSKSDKVARYDWVVKDAVESDTSKMSASEKFKFHYFNGNGLYQKVQKGIDKIHELVDAGELNSGYLLYIRDDLLLDHISKNLHKSKITLKDVQTLIYHANRILENVDKTLYEVSQGTQKKPVKTENKIVEPEVIKEEKSVDEKYKELTTSDEYKQKQYDNWDSLKPTLQELHLRKRYSEEELQQAAYRTFGNGIAGLSPDKAFVDYAVPLETIDKIVESIRKEKGEVKETAVKEEPKVEVQKETKKKEVKPKVPKEPKTPKVTKPKAQLETHEPGTTILINRNSIGTEGNYSIPSKFTDKTISGKVVSAIPGNKGYVVELTYINYNNTTEKVIARIPNKAIIGKPDEVSVSDFIKQESTANKDIIDNSVIASELEDNQEEVPEDIKEAASAPIEKVSEDTTKLINSLKEKKEELLDLLLIATPSEIKDIRSKIKEIDERLGDSANESTSTPVNKGIVAPVNEVSVDKVDEDFPDISTHDSSDFDKLSLDDDSTELNSYQSTESNISYSSENKKIFNKLIEHIDPSAKFSIEGDKIVYSTPKVDFVFLENFREYGFENFRNVESFSLSGSKNVLNAAGVVQYPKGSKPRIFMNGTNKPEDFIKTFIHETVGHFGVRDLFESYGKGDQYKSFLLNLVNNNKELREAVLSRWSSWRMYNIDYFAKTIPQDQTVDQYLDSLVENEDYVIIQDPTGVKKKGIAIPIEVATRYADEHIAELAKDLYFDSEFIKEEVGLGLKQDPVRTAKRNRIKRFLDGVFKRIKHYFVSIFGEYTHTLTSDDLHKMVAASFDHIFTKVNPEEIFEYKNRLLKTKTGRETLHLRKPTVISLQREPVNIEESSEELLSPIYNEKEMTQEEIDNINIRADKLVHRPDAFESLQQFGNLSGDIRNKMWDRLVTSVQNSPLKFLTTFKNMAGQEYFRSLSTAVLGDIALTEESIKKAGLILNSKDFNNIKLKAAYEFFTTKDAELNPELFNKLQISQLTSYKKIINDAGKRLVELDFLDKDIYEKNEGKYLHAVYLQYVRDYKGSGKKTSLTSYLKKKGALSKNEKLALGEIKDVRYLVPETMGIILRDHALLQMFSTVNKASEQGGTFWVLTSDTKVTLPWDRRKKVTIDNAYDYLESIDRQIKGMTSSKSDSSFFNAEDLRYIFGADIADVNTLKNNYDKFKAEVDKVEQEIIDKAYSASGNTSIEKSDFIRNNYIRMPNDRRWGALSNKLVRKEIYSDLDVFMSAYNINNMGSELEKFFAPGGTLERIHRFWKKSMVMYNPGSWLRNIAGNFSLLDLSTPTSSIKLIDKMVDELKSIPQGGTKYWKLANSHGLFGTSYSAVELLDYYGKYADKLTEAIDKHAGRQKGSWDYHLSMFDERLISIIEVGKDLAADKYHRFDNTLSRWYSFIEGAFKTVAFRDYIERWEAENNMDHETLDPDKKEMLYLKAANHANEAIFNYSEVPSAIRFLRRMPLGSPFLTFTYKAAPLMVKSAILNPIKFAKYATLPALLTMIAQAANDWDDDDIRKFKSRLPEYYRNNPGIAFFPFKDEKGRPQILPMDYWIPWNQLSTAASKAYANFMKSEGEGIVGPLYQATGTFINEFGFLGGPLPKSIVALKAGVDEFTGRPIMTPGASPNTQMFEQMSYTFNQFLPAWLANGGYFTRVYDGFTGTTNDQGETIITPGQALSDITGFRTRSVLEKGGTEARKKEFERRLRDVATLRHDVATDRSIKSQQERASKIAAINLREKMIRTQMRKALEGKE